MQVHSIIRDSNGGLSAVTAGKITVENMKSNFCRARLHRRLNGKLQSQEKKFLAQLMLLKSKLL